MQRLAELVAACAISSSAAAAMTRAASCAVIREASFERRAHVVERRAGRCCQPGPLLVQHGTEIGSSSLRDDCLPVSEHGEAEHGRLNAARNALCDVVSPAPAIRIARPGFRVALVRTDP